MTRDKGYIRYQNLRYVVLLAALVIIGRLFYVQLIDDSYDRRATANIMRAEVEYPMRGEVLDRNGEYLVRSRVCYDVMVVTSDIPKSRAPQSAQRPLPMAPRQSAVQHVHPLADDRLRERPIPCMAR